MPQHAGEDEGGVLRVLAFVNHPAKGGQKKVKDTPPQTFLKYFEHASEKTSYKLNNKEK